MGPMFLHADIKDSESLLGAQGFLFVLSCGGSFHIKNIDSLLSTTNPTKWHEHPAATQSAQ